MAGITGRNGKIDPTSEVVKTAPAGGGTPVPEPHHLALTENDEATGATEMTRPENTPPPTTPDAYYSDDSATVIHGDCIEVMRGMDSSSVDAIVTDPPYGLGFMGREWDSLPPGLPWAQECLRVLKPGGHLLAFGGSRTWHRLAVAIEDAGFEMRDSIAWLYGSGFPKSLNVAKAIDTGGRPEDIRRAAMGDDYAPSGRGRVNYDHGGASAMNGTTVAPSLSPLAEKWTGWGTALKPAHEPVVCARKPLNMVPFRGEVNRLHHLIGALLWLSLSPAKRAELSSQSSPAEHDAVRCASALASAATDMSPAESGGTDTYNSPALASTFSNIVSSWSSILGALSAPTSTSTTSMRLSTTTGLQTLSSLLVPLTSQTTMPACECLLSGSPSSAPSVAAGSTGEWASWLRTLSASVPASATEGIALVAASALVKVAESLSADRGAESSAAPTATTGAASSVSPAFEPIVVARKPLAGTVAANVLAHGTGAINVDGCRVEMSDDDREVVNKRSGGTDKPCTVCGAGIGTPPGERFTSSPAGRWPTNVILDGSQAAELDKQTGMTTSRSGGSSGSTFGAALTGTADQRTDPRGGHDDSGGASRFFPTFHYEPKAGATERPRDGDTAHPTVKPVDLMRWLVRLVTPPGGTVLEPFAGSGTTAEACVVEGFKCIAIERDATYLPLIVQRLTKPIQVGLDFGVDGDL